ncbi:MAG: PilZ domain-containing protein [Sphingomonadales bacterium]|nr:PilZ domain-containing protein [Sphingomonadales bacterium]
MGEGENRQITRDSLFVMACLRLKGSLEEHRVRVRNLSPGGLMAEGQLGVVPGIPLEIEIRNVGWIDASVAWVQDNRFGIAFSREIDPQIVRGPGGSNETQDLILRRPMAARVVPGPDPRQLRQI